MKETIQLNKCRGLWGKSLLRLKELERGGRHISWTNVYSKLCRGHSITKQEAREVILILHDLGLLDISPIGILLKFEVKDG